jgi:hypothetical protein
MNRELFVSFNAQKRQTLYRCCRSGAENPDSVIGCYLLHPGDLQEFRAFFDPLIRDHHGASPAGSHVTDSGLDISALGLPELSIRLRVARNLKSFNLPGSMDRAERIRFERSMVRALQSLIDDPNYGGRVYSLTPEFGPGEPNANLITQQEYQDLVDAHIMFKNMDADPYLKSAGISDDWPYGRACYVSRDREVIVWLGEEDQLRIMCMKKGTKLLEIYNRLREVLATIAALPGIEFAYDENFGYVTSCPSNLGTGMRASVHVTMPHVTKGDADTKAICKQLGLSVTPIGTEGVIELSPRRRLFVRERDILVNLYQGLAVIVRPTPKPILQ